ncbi:MAG: hypothetical protein KUG65_03215 [Sphingomonadaceae bacterium]|nr:hypothetical protein [Sphingomonadaceae bacterium]
MTAKADANKAIAEGDLSMTAHFERGDLIWCATQSGANGSQRAFSQINGKLLGNSL